MKNALNRILGHKNENKWLIKANRIALKKLKKNIRRKKQIMPHLKTNQKIKNMTTNLAKLLYRKRALTKMILRRRRPNIKRTILRIK